VTGSRVHIGATGSDSAAAARVKHDIRMAAVLRRALDGRMRRPTGPLTVPDGAYRWRIPVEALNRLVHDARRESRRPMAP
jgi:hypothetical protein